MFAADWEGGGEGAVKESFLETFILFFSCGWSRCLWTGRGGLLLFRRVGVVAVRVMSVCFGRHRPF